MSMTFCRPCDWVRLAGIFLLASVLSVRAQTVTLSFTNSPPSGGATVTNGLTVPVNVVAATNGSPAIQSVSLWFQTLAPLCTNTWNAIPMTLGSNGVYAGTIPYLPAGSANYYASCVYLAGATLTTNVTATNAFVVSGGYLTVRQEVFGSGAWTNNLTTMYSGDGTGWYGTNAEVAKLGGTLADSTGKNLYLLNYNPTGLIYTDPITNPAALFSPVFSQGIGTIYFVACARTNATASFEVDVSTNGGLGWSRIYSNTVSNLTVINPVITNVVYQPAMLRFLRTSDVPGDSTNYSAVVLDDITVSLPPADLSLSLPTNFINPPLPLTNMPVALSCNAADVSTNIATFNRRMTLWYNWNSTGWASLAMTNTVGISTQYQASLTLGAGTNQYYFRADYDGYYYTNTDKRGPRFLPAGGASSPTSYVINAANIYAINVNPTNLVFGSVATNGSANQTVQVFNTGNVLLTISNITCSATGYTVSPTNFTLAAGATQNVTVTFAPTTLDLATGLLTVVSGAMQGTNTVSVSGTGIPADAVTTPLLTATSTTNVTLFQNVTFSASSTDSVGYAVQYQFDWGNGTTSAWSVATIGSITVSNSWGSVGTYNVRAQARSATNPAVVSAWSAPANVNVFYVYGIGVTPSSLSFGNVATNASSTLSLVVTNTGNGPLTVSNVTFSTSGFQAASSNFVIAVGGSTNLNITFAPTLVQAYSGIVTVLSVATTGVNTASVSGNGIPMETVSQPTLSPSAASATLGQWVTFTASTSTDNWGYAVQYQFDWGNGTTSTWATASGGSLTVSNAWGSVGAYNVRAQARSATNTTVVSGWSTPSVVTIAYTYIIGVSPATLSFGSVTTNTSSSLVLVVTNAGNGSLTISNVTSAASVFHVSPTNFVLAAGLATNLNVAFIPALVQAYTGTLTVISSATSGVNTASVSGTGMPMEAVTTPTISPASSAGTVNQWLTFTAATSTDNWVYPVQYQIDWGNGATSAWSAAGSTFTTSNAWSTATNFSVRAQARSSVNTNILSAWSASASVTITNIIGIGLSGSLAFGTVPQYTSATNILQVLNTGNGPLVVTAVSCPTSFTASPQAFTVPVGGSTNVNVVFTPPAITSYVGTVTVVCNMTTGTNTIPVSGTGVGAESVTTPVLSGPLYGFISNSLTYTITQPATDNWNNAVQYQYVWGNGQTGWATNALAASNIWTTASTNTVIVKARSAAHTNVIATSAALTVVITQPPVIVFNNGQPITNDIPLPVTASISATAGTFSNVIFYYQPPHTVSTNYVGLPLAFASGTSWTNTIPPFTAGTMNYFLQIQFTNGFMTYPVSGYLSTNLTGNIGNREEIFQVSGIWSNNLGAQTTSDSMGWYATNATVAKLGTAFPDPTYKTNLYLHNYTSTTGYTDPTTNPAELFSPLFTKGIGSIYFAACVVGANASASFMVNVSTNGGVSWFSVGSYTIKGGTTNSSSILLNLRQAAMVQFLRTSDVFGDNYGNSDIALNDIYISSPAADVTLSEMLHNPGYPNAEDPTLVRCVIADTDPVNTPTVNHQCACTYKAGGGGWTVVPMTNALIDGISCFQGTIPAFLPGTKVYYYFTCQFDGYYFATTTNGVAVTENMSPEYYSNLGTQPTPPSSQVYCPSYTVRSYRSDIQTMSIVTTNITLTTIQASMSQISDYTWQGLILLNNNVTNLQWLFSGTAYYANDATNFAATQSWGDTNQAFPYPPLSGTASLNATNNPMVADLQYNGYLVFQFNENSGSYLVKRAVYQDFNTPVPWQAAPDYFEQSYSAYTADIFTNNFASWATDSYLSAQMPMEDFQGETPGIWRSTAQESQRSWMYQESMVIQDRPYLAALSTGTNQALYLNNQSIAPGQFWNSEAALSPVGGIQSLTFRTRLSVPSGSPALWTKNTSDTNWNYPYRVVCTNYALSISPGTNAAFSMLMCYQQNRYDPTINSYYEFRVSEATDSSGTDSRIQLQLFRWTNGLSASLVSSGVSSTGQRLDNGAPPLTMDITWDISGTNVVFTGSVSRISGAATNTIFVLSTNTWKDAQAAANGMNTGGLIGLNCSDILPQVQNVQMFICATNAYADPKTTLQYDAAVGSFASSEWYYGGKRASDGQPWWQANGTPAYLWRPLTISRLDTYTAQTSGAGLSGPPDWSWTNNAQSISVSSLGYVTNTVVFNTWQTLFLKSQWGAGDLPVVLDNVSFAPWLGVTRGQPFSWENPSSDNNILYWNWPASSFTTDGNQYDWSRSAAGLGWAIFQGFVTGAVGSTNVVFDATRANPGNLQGILTPDLSNGVGSVQFQASVSSGTSVYEVDCTSPNNNLLWNTIQVFTNVAGDTTNHFLNISQLGWGRVRIIQLPGSSTSNAVLTIGNLTALGYPPQNLSSWVAYNALIASPDGINNTGSRYDANNPSPYQTCYLNNSMTNNTIVPMPLDSPYLQTPQLGTGIGEISLNCRAWDSSAPVYLTFLSTADLTLPLSQWTVITNVIVTTTFYTNIDFQVYDTKDQYLRVYNQLSTGATNTDRFCLGNILVTEPVQPGYSITHVLLAPAQPLYTNTVQLQATVGRFLQNPSNIQLYASYYVGTNVWGYPIWRGTGFVPNSNNCVTLPMQSIGGNTYITTTGIPAQPVDQVVQYIIWGTFAGISTNYGSTPVFQGTNAFQNPSWYYPVDLNAQYETNTTVWSPYYFSYSCPVGSVWFNEINYYVNGNDFGYEYVELAGPVGTDVSNWRIDTMDPTVPPNVTVFNTTTFPPATTLQQVATNGFAFLVWGDDVLTNNIAQNYPEYYDPRDRVDFTFPSANGFLMLYDTGGGGGGLRLVRSNGAYEYRIGYSSDIYNENGIITNLLQNGYQFIGSKATYYINNYEALSPLQLENPGTNGNTYSSFIWLQPAEDGDWTPGWVNNGQHFPVPPLPSAYWVYSTISANGWQSVGSGIGPTTAAVQLTAGSSTSITYVANDWYRIASFVTNGQSVAVAVGQRSNTVTIVNIAGPVSNNVSFAMAAAIPGIPSYIPISWMAGWGQTEATPFLDRYSLGQDWLLNMDPYVTNTVFLGIVSTAISNTSANVGVQLLINGAAPVNPLNGQLALFGENNLTNSGWNYMNGTATTTLDANGKHVYTLSVTNAPEGFCKAAILTNASAFVSGSSLTNQP